MFMLKLRRIAALIKKEFLAIWRDPKSRALIIGPPLLQLLLFAHAVTMEVKNIDMAVFDRCNTVHSRELISSFEHSRWFRKVTYVQNDAQLKYLIDTQRVQIALILNGDFEKNLKLKKPTSVEIVVDGRQTNSASIAGNYAVQIISQFEAQYFKSDGARVVIQPRSWFNPNLTYQWFTVVFLVSMLSLVVTLLLTSLSIARERELGTFDQLLVSPLSPTEILTGKTIPPLIIAVALTCFMATMAILIFKVPFVGNVFLFFVATFVALLAIVGVGLFISSICKTQQQAILGVFTFQMPAVLLSGFISPIEDMPVFLQYLTYINPLRFYILITKGIFLKGMGAIDVFYNLIPLIFIAIITLSLASWMFKRKLD